MCARGGRQAPSPARRIHVRCARGANEIEPGQARLVDVKGKEIALFNVDGEFFALDNTCTHRGGPLAEGEVAGHKVTCPWHGATFDPTARR